MKAGARRRPIDFILFLSMLMLLAIGIVMVFSASTPNAQSKNTDVYHYLKSQLMFAGMGMVALIVLANIDYRKFEKFAPLALVGSLVLLILVLIPGIGRPIKDTWRWFEIAGVQFQPSEIAKFAIILFFASSLTKRRNDLKYFFKGFCSYLLILGVFAGLLLLEPHLSGTIIIVMIALVMLFSAGAKIGHFLIVASPLAAIFAVVVIKVEYMRIRVLSFLNPWNDPMDSGWQVIQSLYAIGSGGLFGRGLGRSMQKFLYISEPTNDFIFSVLAEELGFIGVLLVISLFAIFIWRGIKIAINISDMFGSLLAIGITSQLAIQVILNIGVVTSSIPPTGVSLPFISSGGTSLIMFMAEVGVLLNISRYSKYERI